MRSSADVGVAVGVFFALSGVGLFRSKLQAVSQVAHDS